jgi:hypothetical protein
MAVGIPPPPLNSPNGSYYWLEWYTNLTNFLNNQNIPWSALNFSNSNIADIQHRDHNALTNIQGGNASGTATPTGNAYHLMGYGYVSADALTNQLPSGWSASNTGTGVYTITHNLALTVPNYMAGASSNTPGFSAMSVDTSSPNQVTVRTAVSGSPGTPANSSFSVWIGML